MIYEKCLYLPSRRVCRKKSKKGKGGEALSLREVLLSHQKKGFPPSKGMWGISLNDKRRGVKLHF